jgi:hypothetical protein
MTIISASNTNDLFEEKPAGPFLLFEIPRKEPATPAVEPEAAPGIPDRKLNFPDFFPVYPFL